MVSGQKCNYRSLHESQFYHCGIVPADDLGHINSAGNGSALIGAAVPVTGVLARRQGLTDPRLDELLVSITPEDLEAGEERARFWPGLPPTQNNQ